jgi:sialate O-acetylesterase
LKDEKLQGLLHHWWKNPEYPQWCRERAALNLTEWIEEPIQGREPPHPFAPAFLWNAGVQPLLPFPVRGVLWYQGESNATVDGGRGAPVAKEINRRKFEALIGAWRWAWREEGLPVYYVQLPGLNRKWPIFREMQLEVSKEVPGVGMAVTIDVGHSTNVHPNKKKPVGERLAGLALGKTYGKELVCESPVVKQVKYDQHLAWVEFDQPIATKGNEEVLGVEVAGRDRVFHPGTVMIQRKVIAVRSDEVKAVVAVRYAWANDPKGNLINKEGLPVSPFRSDGWSDEKE